MADTVRVPQLNIQMVKDAIPKVKLVQLNIQVVKKFAEPDTEGSKAMMFLVM